MCTRSSFALFQNATVKATRVSNSVTLWIDKLISTIGVLPDLYITSSSILLADMWPFKSVFQMIQVLIIILRKQRLDGCRYSLMVLFGFGRHHNKLVHGLQILLLGGMKHQQRTQFRKIFIYFIVIIYLYNYMSKVFLIALIVLILIIIISIFSLLYWYNSNKAAAMGASVQPQASAEPQLGPSPQLQPPPTQDVLYSKPGTAWPYTDANEVTYDNAKKYCASNDGRLATTAEFKNAYAKKSFDYPVWGWTNDGDLIYATNVPYDWQPNPGIGHATNQNRSLTRGAWCVGAPPADTKFTAPL